MSERLRIDGRTFVPLVSGGTQATSVSEGGSVTTGLELASQSAIARPGGAKIFTPSTTEVKGKRLVDLERTSREASRRPEGLFHLVQAVSAGRDRLFDLVRPNGGEGGLPKLAAKIRDRYKAYVDALPEHRRPPLDEGVFTALAIQELGRFVDDSGQLDLARLRKSYPDEGWRVAELLARTQPKKNDLFGADARGVEWHLMRLDEIDRKLVDEIVQGMWQIPRALPAVDGVVERTEGQPFEGWMLFGVQHLLSSQAPMFEAFEKLGMAAEDMHLLGVPYSTSPLMSWYFRRRGHEVWEGDAGAGDMPNNQCDYHEQRLHEVEKRLFPLIQKAIQDKKRILVLDDGGLVAVTISKLVDKHPELAWLFKVVEQTTRGMTEVGGLDVRWTEIDVATSAGKELESEHVARSLAKSLVDQVSRLGIRDPKGVPITVAGFGRVGAATARVLAGLGFAVTVLEADTPLGKKRVEEAKAEGMNATVDAKEAAKSARIFVGLTGHLSIDRSVLDALPPGAIVASGSSAEIEVAVGHLRNRAHKVTGDRYEGHFDDLLEVLEQIPIEGPSKPLHIEPKLRKIHHFDGETYFFGKDAPFHSEVPHGVTQELLLNGKSLLLLNDGRPINFNGLLDNIEPEYIQVTRALMLQAAIQAVKSDNPGVEKLDPKAQEPIIEGVESAWAKHPPDPVRHSAPTLVPQPKVPKKGRDLTTFETRTLRSQWNDYLANLDQVVPRSEEARERSHFAVYRDESGALRHVSLSGYGQQAFEPRVLPELPGELMSFRELGSGLAALTIEDPKSKEVSEHLIALDDLSLVHSRRKSDALVTMITPEGATLYEREGERLIARKTGEKAPFAEAHFGPSSAIFGLEASSTKFDLEHGSIYAVERSPPVVRTFGLDLAKGSEIDLSKSLKSVNEVYPSEGRGAIGVAGVGKNGRVTFVPVSIADRRAGAAVELPEGAELEWSYYDAKRDEFTLTYRPKDAAKDPRWFERMTVKPPR
jgi:hypothetical protein